MNQNTTAIYARLNLDPVRASVNLATAAIIAASKVKDETEKLATGAATEASKQIKKKSAKLKK